MSHRRLQRLLIAVGLGAVVVGVVAALAIRPGAEQPDGDVAEGFRGSVPPLRSYAVDFTLSDALTGEEVGMRAQRGRVVLLTFLESRCQAACPLIASQVALALRRLRPGERRQVTALAISSNPADDSAASVRAFLRRHRAVREIRYLNRPRDELRRVWRAYQVVSALETGDADTHSAPVRIYGRDGRWLATQHAGADLSVDNLVHDLRLALSG